MASTREVKRVLVLLRATLRAALRIVRELELLVLPLACAGCDEPDIEVCSSCFWSTCAAPYLVMEDRLPIYGAVPFVGTNRSLVARWKDHGRAGLVPFIEESARISSTGLIVELLKLKSVDKTTAKRSGQIAPQMTTVDLGSSKPHTTQKVTTSELHVCVIPLPSSSTATRIRGFVPARVVAQGVVAAIKQDVLNGAVPQSTKITVELRDGMKTGRTKADQSALGRLGRRANIRGQIRASRELIRTVEASDFVLLVDDVVTTGATFNEAHREISHRSRTMVAGFSMFVTPKTMPLAKSDLKSKKQPHLK